LSIPFFFIFTLISIIPPGRKDLIMPSIRRIVFDVLCPFLLPILLFGSTGAYSHAQQLKILHFTTQDGLAHDIGYEIIQDRKGYIWIGTDNGLSRFDGSRFKNFTVEDGLASPYIITLSEGPDGAIWAGAYRNGINKLIGDSITHYKMPSGTLQWKALFSGNKGLIFDRHSSSFLQHFIWFDENQGKLDVLDSIFIFKNFKEIAFSKEEDKWAQEVNSENFRITNILPEGQSNRLIGISNRGVIHFSIKRDSLLIKNVFQPSGSFQNLCSGNGKSIFALGEDKIYELRSNLELIGTHPLPPGSYRQLIIDQEGHFFLTRKDGFGLLYSINGEYVDIYPRLNINTPISRIFMDRQNRLWITTAGDGLFMVDWSYIWSYSKEEGLSNSFIKHLRQGPYGSIYASSSTDIYRFSDSQWQSFYHEKNKQPIGQAEGLGRFFPLENQCALLFTNKGLLLLDNEGSHPFLGPVTTPRSHLPSDKGLFFFTKEHSQPQFLYAPTEHIPLQSPEKSREIFQSFPIADSLFFRHPSIVMKDSKNRIWIGTSNGVLLYYEDQVRRFTQEDGLADNYINEIVEDSLGRIWVGTIRGACFLDFKGKGEWHTSPVLVKGDIQSIVFASSRSIWLGTRTGLIYYHLELDQQRRFTEESNLVSSYINDLLIDKQQRLWIATKYGISMIDLKAHNPAMIPPALYIEKVAVENESVDLSFPLSLAHDENIDIFYSAVVPPSSRQVLFAYRIGPQKVWRETEEDHLSFSALKPGPYEFSIKARSSDSQWSAERKIIFYIHPPWYRQWWAYFIYLLGGSLFFGTLYRRRIRQLAQQGEVNQRLARMELSALQAQINPHFLFNTLNSIQHLFYRSDVLTTNRYFSQFANLMRHFLDSSRELETPLSKEVNQLKMYLNLEKLRFEEHFNFSLKVNIEDDPNELMIPTMVIQPFVENAINHGLLPKKGPGELNISIEQQADWLHCSIDDNGIGRAKARINRQHSEKNHKSRGMALVYERLEVLNQIREEEILLSITDKMDKTGNALGTRVDLKIPIINLQ
jgi:ligand-binding sensor domain-containing protein